MRLGAHFGLAFAAPTAIALSSPQPLSRRFMMQKVRSQAFRLRGIALELLVGMRFQVLLTPLTGVLFTFPSRYFFSIGPTVVFSLTSWSRLIHTGFHVPRATRDSARLLELSTTGLSPPLVQDSAASSNRYSPSCCPTTPPALAGGLGCSPFARRY